MNFAMLAEVIKWWALVNIFLLAIGLIRDKSADSFYHQFAAWVPDMFGDFYLQWKIT